MMDLISAERRELTGVLEGLTAEQWRSPSLCAGWTTAHVVAHLTLPFRITEEELGRGMAEVHGDFTEFSDAVAARDSQLPQAELTGVLRDNIDNPWGPPGGGQQGQLSHDLIHGFDIAWPLSITYPIPDQAMTTVLDLITGHDGQSVFGVDLDGIELRASDLDWSSGSGAQAAGPSRDLLLLLARRSLPYDAVTGPGAQRLRGAAR
jgi:uncharacterized protein (TIGR03083 family)